MIRTRCTRALILSAAAVSALLAAGSPALGASLRPRISDPSSIVPIIYAPATRTIRVGSQDIRVTVAVRNLTLTTFSNSTGRGGPGSVRVTLAATDGSPLPEGLTAVNVRLERVVAPRRVFRAENDASYASNILTDFLGNVRLRAAVRIEVDGRPRIVRMGITRVTPGGVTSSPGTPVGPILIGG
jgi:hypothetical protein